MGTGQQSTHSVWLHLDKILENIGCLQGDDGLVLSFTSETNKLTKVSQGRKSLFGLQFTKGCNPPWWSIMGNVGVSGSCSQEAESKQKVGSSYRNFKSLPPETHFLPWGSISFQNSITSWGPRDKTQEPMRHISYSNHKAGLPNYTREFRSNGNVVFNCDHGFRGHRDVRTD